MKRDDDMNTKLIMVEGIPGAGKTTIAKRIADYYNDRNVTVNLFTEGQAHPADLAWTACVPVASVNGLILHYEEIENEIIENMRIEGDNALIAYTKVKTNNISFYKELESYEVYNNRVSADLFKKLHYSRWQSFGEAAFVKNELNVFECVFLQNHVNELQNYHLAEKMTIKSHLDELLSSVLKLSPVLIYLTQSSVRETIRRISNERISEHGKWIDMASAYVENSPYGKRHGLIGFDGLIRCIEDRKQIELDIIKTIPIKYIIVENEEYDWNKVWQDIEAFLGAL